jgi:hypothetical protein
MHTEYKSGKICDELEKTIADQSSSFDNEENKKLEEFYQEMLRLGIAKKQGYDADPLDTIGRKAYEEMERAREESGNHEL